MSHLRRNQLVRLVHSHAEMLEVLQNVVDLRDRKVNQHASNLRSFGSLEGLDEAEKLGTNLVLVKRILGNHTLDERRAF